MTAAVTMSNVVRAIESALSFLPADSRDMWVRMGMAVKSGLGDAGFELWNSWSMTAANYNEQDAKAVWQSLSSEGGVTIATLYYEAQHYGFQRNGLNRSHLPFTTDTADRERKTGQVETEKMGRQAHTAARA